MNKPFINFGISHDRCNRRFMEDFNKIEINDDLSYFSICDGHGGDLVAKYVNEFFFQKFLENSFMLNTHNYYDFFYNICMDIDEEVKKNISLAFTSGSTYIGLIFYKNNIFIVNVGDSIINININNTIVFQNIKHTPNNYDEYRRILKTQNVYNGRIKGIINISRSFGDFYFKYNTNIEDNPIICIPDVTMFNINKFLYKKTFFLIASDGILLQLSLAEINLYIYNMLIKGYDPQYITQKILNYFVKNKNKDNLTLIIVVLNNFIDK